MRFAGLLFGCVLLLACRNGERCEAPPAAAAKPPEAPAARDSRPVMACFGDSLTAGLGADPGRAYPDNLQRLLDREGYRYRVVDLGVNGDTTTDGLARIDSALRLQPAIVVLELGANDGLRGLPVAAIKANLEQTIVAFQKAGAQVVLAGMMLPPNYGPEYANAFQKIFPDLAARYRLPLIPFFLEGVAGDARLMQRDGLHPTTAGYARVGLNVMQTLRPLLKK